MNNIMKLRDHRVLDFAYEELCKMATTHQVAEHHEQEQIQEQWIIGTWDDCVNQLTLDESMRDWPWNPPGNVAYDHDAYTIFRNGNAWILTGKSERSTLYAVYEYCKKHWKMEWIYPDETSTNIANRSTQDVMVSIEQPEFKRRGFVYENLKDKDYLVDVVDWLGKNKLNELFLTFPLWDYVKDMLQPELEKRGIDLTLGGHSMKFFTEGMHAVGMNHDGSAPAFAGHKQLNYEDESWQQLVIADIVAYCQSIPMLTRISLWPEDTAVSDDQIIATPFILLYQRFTERLQDAFTLSGSAIKAEHIAYNAGLSWKMLELDEGSNTSSQVNTLFAYWGRDYSQGFHDCDRSEEQRAYHNLENWIEGTQKNLKELTIFEYYSDHYMLSHLFPIMPERIYNDLNHYRTLGIHSIVNLVVPYPQAGDTYSWKWAQGYNSYMFARSAWGDSLATIKADYWNYASEEIRTYLEEAVDKVGEILSRISYYNVPLFPARVVDVQVANKEGSADVIAILQQLNEELRGIIHEIQCTPYEEQTAFKQYFEHLFNISNELVKEWKKP
ncbi:hypothetical protein [Paenibacillus sp. CMAA1364]